MQNDYNNIFGEINLTDDHKGEKIKKQLDDTTKKVHEERKKSKKKRIFLISTIIIFLLLTGILMIYLFYKKENKYTFKNYNLYQYFSGVKVNYEGKVTIKKDGEITKISQNAGIENVEDSPIYFKDFKNQVFFASNMSLIIPREKNGNYKIKYFTKLITEDDANNAYLICKNGKKIFLDESFLYDGNNLYFFIYDTKIIVDEKEFNLSSLSYAIVNYKGQVEIYDRKKDKYIIIDNHSKDVICNLGEYKINLSTDMIMYKNENRLLLKGVDNLPLYELKK